MGVRRYLALWVPICVVIAAFALLRSPAFRFAESAISQPMATIEPGFVSKWGTNGSGDGQFWYPQGIAVDGAGRVYVADTVNHRIQVFSSEGAFLCKWGSEGSGDGQFQWPEGVAVDGGNVYVADSNNDRIQVFSPAGAFLRKWGAFGSGDSQFYYPTGIAVDGAGHVYVADNGNDRIQKFTAAGSFLGKWGSDGSSDGQFSGPSSVGVDGAGNVYVADSYNHRVQVFSSAGALLDKWGSEGSGDGQFYFPYGIAVDGAGNVYVADSNNHRIQKFGPEAPPPTPTPTPITGFFLGKWGTEGSGDGQFAWPTSLAVDASGNVYVADPYNSRIEKFAPNGTFLLKWGAYGTGNGQFRNPQSVAVDSAGNVYVTESAGNRVQKFSPDGTFMMKWGFWGEGYGQFRTPFGLDVDSSGNIYVADDENNNRIEKFDSSGTYLAQWSSGNPFGVAVDCADNVYVTYPYQSRIQKFDSSGTSLAQWGTFGSSDGQLNHPWGVAVDASGNVYVADGENNRIQVFSSTGSFLYKWGELGSGDGQFNTPEDVAVDGSGNVYVADAGNHRIQKFSPAIQQLGCLQILKFNDLNGNGVQDGEGVLSGWQFTVTGPGSYSFTGTTNASGLTAVAGLVPGSYTAVETVQAGWRNTKPGGGVLSQSTAVAAGATASLTFGNQQLGGLQILKFNDGNGNGVQDGEGVLSGWQFTITGPGGYSTTQTTNASGQINLTNLAPGTYTALETLQAGWRNTKPGGGALSQSATVTVGANASLTFGNQPEGVSIGAPADVPVGGEFVARVYITQVSDLAGSQFDLSYDPTVLQVLTVMPGSIGGGTMPVDRWAFIPTGVQGKIRVLGHVSPVAPLNGSGYLAEVRLRVVGSATQTSGLAFSQGKLFDSHAKQIAPMLWVDGLVRFFRPGDAVEDGELNIADVIEIERIIVGLDARTAGADANLDDMIDLADVLKVERIMVGLDPG